MRGDVMDLFFLGGGAFSGYQRRLHKLVTLFLADFLRYLQRKQHVDKIVFHLGGSAQRILKFHSFSFSLRSLSEC